MRYTNETRQREGYHMGREKLVDKLRKIMALRDRASTEGEAQAAAAHLARLLEKHNLEVADLEAAGQTKPAIQKEDFRVSENPFNDPTVKWKLALAEAVAEHFYCYAMVDNWSNRVQFIGRPENLETMTMLFEWFIKQIKQLSKVARREHLAETGEDIAGIRWQISFADGAVARLGERLFDEREKHATVTSTSLVVSHASDISDWAEENIGYRFDGRKTVAQEERVADYKERIQADENLLKDDPEGYYRKYPERHPDAVAKREMQDAARRRRNDGRRRRYREARAGTRDTLGGVEPGIFGGDRGYGPATDWEAEDQKAHAAAAGYRDGDKINIRPHVEGGREDRKKLGR